MSLTIIHYGFPIICFVYYGLALAITVCTLQTQSLRIKDQHVRRDVMIFLILVVSGSYVSSFTPQKSVFVAPRLMCLLCVSLNPC